MKYKKGDLVYAWRARTVQPSDWVLAIVTDVTIVTLDGHASVQYKVFVVNPGRSVTIGGMPFRPRPYLTRKANGLKPASPGVDCGV